MTAEAFVYWLQGALELGQRKELNEAQVKIIQDHLNLVLKKVTPDYKVPQLPGQIGIGIRPFNLGDGHGAVC